MGVESVDPSLLWGGLLAAIAALAMALRWIVRNARPTNGHERALQRHIDEHFTRVEDRLGRIEKDLAVLKARVE